VNTRLAALFRDGTPTIRKQQKTKTGNKKRKVCAVRGNVCRLLESVVVVGGVALEWRAS